jgi:hypothetical protein
VTYSKFSLKKDIYKKSFHIKNKNEELLNKEFPEAMAVLRPETNEDN